MSARVQPFQPSLRIVIAVCSFIAMTKTLWSLLHLCLGVLDVGAITAVACSSRLRHRTLRALPMEACSSSWTSSLLSSSSSKRWGCHGTLSLATPVDNLARHVGVLLLSIGATMQDRGDAAYDAKLGLFPFLILKSVTIAHSSNGRLTLRGPPGRVRVS